MVMVVSVSWATCSTVRTGQQQGKSACGKQQSGGTKLSPIGYSLGLSTSATPSRAMASLLRAMLLLT